MDNKEILTELVRIYTNMETMAGMIRSMLGLPNEAPRLAIYPDTEARVWKLIREFSKYKEPTEENAEKLCDILCADLTELSIGEKVEMLMEE